MFYPPELMEKARANAARYGWAREIQSQAVHAAEPWLQMSDDELWALMFGPALKRSWMVWSDGYCPSCNESVPMYTWEIDGLARPWKVRCPHCQELFPKNDFHSFYLSGLDERAVFDPARADRGLLFNQEHPEADDPLRSFGVEDGNGYVQDGHTWWFIGAYLIYGQWKKAVLGGAKNLAAAYVATGDADYAHKALVILDRVADLYPDFDFETQGVLFEGRHVGWGYLSNWHDSCEETRELAMAYDQVSRVLDDDAALVSFLSAKAAKHGLANAKTSSGEIRLNIEERILKDALANPRKIHSNYPARDITMAVIHTALNTPEDTAEAHGILNHLVEVSTSTDGLTGEKGLAHYAALVPQRVAAILSIFARSGHEFLKNMVARHPRLHDMFRFYIDTLCLGDYYPNVGDSGAFAQKAHGYEGVTFTTSPGIGPSMFTFLWQLYEITGDAAFVQVLYRANACATGGLPYDLFADDPEGFQKSVQAVIDREGPEPRLGSLNKAQWRLALLRSGEGERRRVLWLHYQSGEGHGHRDGMNLGLFAFGLDLLPDFGYPPVNYGGWESPRALWYTQTAAHNTVAVDAQDQEKAVGDVTLWADGEVVHAARASAPQLIGGRTFERTCALIDISPRDCYVLDIFRVAGGSDHARFFHSSFSKPDSSALTLKSAPDYWPGGQMRRFRSGPAPGEGWSVEWAIEDRYGYASPGAEVRLRLTDLTGDAEVCAAEAWVATSGFASNDQAWIPCVITRRRSEVPGLESTFVSVLEPFDGESQIASIRRLPLRRGGSETPKHGSDVAVEVRLASGRADLIVYNGAVESADAAALIQPGWGVQTDAQLIFARKAADGSLERIAISGGTFAAIPGAEVKLTEAAGFVEIGFEAGRVRMLAGDVSSVAYVLVDGTPVPVV